MSQQQTPKISVLVAIYNVGLYLNECLDSLKNQTLQDAEFILVDDCSSDNSLEICNQYAKSDSRFKVIRHTENKGSLLVRKTGIQNAQGMFCIFLDGDDFLYSNEALEFLVNSIDQNSCDLLYFQAATFQDCSSHETRIFTKTQIKEKRTRFSSTEFLNAIYSEKQTLSWNFSNKCFRSEILKQITSFIPERYLICAEDAFLCFMAGCLITNANISREKIIYAYRIGSGISTSKATPDNINRHAEQLVIIPWIKAFIQNKGLSSFHCHLVDRLRHQLLIFFIEKLNDLEDDHIKLNAFRILFSPELIEEMTAALLGLIKDRKDLKKIRRYDRAVKFIPWLKI